MSLLQLVSVFDVQHLEKYFTSPSKPVMTCSWDITLLSCQTPLPHYGDTYNSCLHQSFLQKSKAAEMKRAMEIREQEKESCMQREPFFRWAACTQNQFQGSGKLGSLKFEGEISELACDVV